MDQRSELERRQMDAVNVRNNRLQNCLYAVVYLDLCRADLAVVSRQVGRYTETASRG
jgi:hypothetical protein